MIQKIFFQIAKWLVGLLFIFSGLIKANDPLGFSYKLQEYFDVFQLGFLNNLAVGIAIILCAAEIILGFLLLLGLFREKVVKGLLILIVFFTFLTFVSAVFKVVTSCGCFGDAIPLTPWQSFSKDVVLLVLIVFLFRKRAWINPVSNHSGIQSALLSVVFFVSLLVGIYTYNYLPFIDFLPYKIGSNIPQNMQVPAGAKPDEYLIIYDLKNKKTGETKNISDKEYLSSGIWKDENWEVLGSPSRKLIKLGYQVKIRDLVIADMNGADYTKELLENPFFSFIIVAYDLHHTNTEALGKLNALAYDLQEQYNIRVVLLTNTNAKEAELISKKMNLVMEIFYADAVPLKSMVRANPGVLFLKGGTILNKWHYHSVPSLDQLSSTYFKY